MIKYLENRIRKCIDIYRGRKRIKLISQEYRKVKGRTVFLLQTPIHTNIGDQAIAQAEVQFIKKRMPDMSLVEINQGLMHYFCDSFPQKIRKDDVIMLHGGGNMGDQYLNEENLRRRAVESFPKNKIVIFPQTFYFTDTEQGREELEVTRNVFLKHSNLTVIAREEFSFGLMTNIFKGVKILLTPDIVLSMSELGSALERKGILIVLRNDVEKILTNAMHDRIVKLAESFTDQVTVTDMYNHRNVMDSSYREEVLSFKFDQFKRAGLVVTDRLHGMIFAAITGTPCLAFSNYNQKVSGTYHWIKKLNYIRFIDTEEDVEGHMKYLLSLNSIDKFTPDDYVDLFQKIVDDVEN